LVCVLVIVVVVVLFGGIELLQWLDFSHYFVWRARVLPLLADLAQYPVDLLLLLLVPLLIENYGTVLGACVVALTVQRRRVVGVHEDVE
jgi:hypothetical protein